jgi:hypothetical protein
MGFPRRQTTPPPWNDLGLPPATRPVLGERNADMVSAAPALNHEERLGPSTQVEDRAAQGRLVVQGPPVDAQHHIAGLEPDPRRPAPRAHRVHDRPAPGLDAQTEPEELLGQVPDRSFRDRLGADRDLAGSRRGVQRQV